MELSIVLALLVGWQFSTAELIGELPMIINTGRFIPAVYAPDSSTPPASKPSRASLAR